MNLPPEPKDNNFSSWQLFFRQLDAAETGFRYNDALKQLVEGISGPWQAINFHAAAIDRLLEHSGLNPDLSDDQRKACLRFAEHGIGIVETIWASDPEKVKKLKEAVAASKKLNAVFGTPTARALVWERLHN
jgi:hypothetical protein